jgi:hypothetical protein
VNAVGCWRGYTAPTIRAHMETARRALEACHLVQAVAALTEIEAVEYAAWLAATPWAVRELAHAPLCHALRAHGVSSPVRPGEIPAPCPAL